MADPFRIAAIDQALEEFKRTAQQAQIALATAEAMIRETKPKVDAVLEEADLLLKKLNSIVDAVRKLNG